MKSRKDLMKKLCIAGGVLGYTYMKYLPIWFRLVFITFAFVAVIAYIVQSKKNNYSKVSIRISILALILFITLFLNELVMYKYPESLGYRGYIMALSVIIIITMLIISAVNYIKISNKREGLLAKILLLFIIISVLVIIAGIILKKCGVIP